MDCECGRCEEGKTAWWTARRQIRRSPLPQRLARSPIQFSHFLSEGTATELSSGQQWQTRCDQALLSAQNGSLLLPAAGFKSPRQPSRPGRAFARPPLRRADRRERHLSPSPSLRFGNVRFETVCAASSSSAGALGPGAERSYQKVGRAAATGGRMLCPRSRALPLAPHPTPTPGRAPALTLRGWGELRTRGGEESGLHCGRRAGHCNLLLSYFRFLTGPASRPVALRSRPPGGAA